MKPKAICENCGAKMVEYKFGLNKGLLSFLKKLALAHKPVHLDELGLTNSEYSNYPKSRYWHLTEMLTPTNELELRKGGKWQLTEQGIKFLRASVKLPKHVHTVRGKPMRYSGGEIFVYEIEEGYSYKGDYKAQAQDQIKSDWVPPDNGELFPDEKSTMRGY